MTELVLNISKSSFRSLSERSSGVFKRFSTPASKKEILIIGAILIVLQILDGFFTVIGVAKYGPTAEANVLIRYLIHQFGNVTALISIKIVAIGIVVTLCHLAPKVHWVPSALKGVIALYLFAAIIPWTAILLLNA